LGPETGHKEPVDFSPWRLLTGVLAGFMRGTVKVGRGWAQPLPLTWRLRGFHFEQLLTYVQKMALVANK
jgi:hypothetical protein